MIKMLGLDQTMAVYTRNDLTGDFDVLDASGIACRLSHVSTAGLGLERAQMNQSRALLWGPEYTLPPGAEVVVEGERWKTVSGTEAAFRGPSGTVIYKRVDCERAP